MEKKKIAYIEYLRVFTAFIVILVHIGMQGFDQPNMTSLDMAFFYFLKGFRWPIGVFAMITGTLLLGRDIDIKVLYKKYIFRVFVTYVAWRLIYFVYYFALTHDAYSSIITEPFHMWYLPVLLGLYVAIPLFRLLVKDKKVTEYYLVSSYVIAFIIPQIQILVSDFVPTGKLNEVLTAFTNLFVSARLDVLCGFGFFYVLGYYVTSYTEIAKKQEVIIYILGVLGLFTTAALVMITGNQDHYGFFFIHSSTPVLAIFVFFMKHVKGTKLLDKIVFPLGRLSLGIYLVHVLVIGFECEFLNLYVGRANPFISVPALAVFTFAVSAGITWILGKIPIAKKYLV